MKPIHRVSVMLLVLAIAGAPDAHATSRIRWLPDMSREQDSVPPSRPKVQLVAIHRAEGDRLFYESVPREGKSDTLMLLAERSSSASEGRLELLVRARDDHASLDQLGWRARVVAGALPALVGIPVPGAQYRRRVTASEADPPGWSTLHVRWRDWSPEMGDHRDSLHAGIVITCLDRAGNESEPSDTLWIQGPAR